MNSNNNGSKETVLTIIIISIVSVVIGAILIIIASYQGNLISVLKEEILKEIGIALIIIGIASLFYEQFLRMKMIDIVANIMNDFYENKCEFKSIKRLGLKNLYRTSADNEIINVATKEIKLLGITTDYYFRNVGGNHFRTLLDLVTQGCKLKILMLNPKSIHVYYRGIQENDANLKSAIESSFNSKIIFINGLPQNSKQNVEIKFYNSPPHCSMTIIDDCLIRVTPFLDNKVGLLCPTSDYERKPGGIFDSYLDHFNELWNKKRLLFNWSNVPGKDTELLKKFLNNNYGLSCIKDENISKSEDGNEIIVVHSKINVWIRLNSIKTIAALSIECGRTDDLIADFKNGKSDIYIGTIDALA